MITATHFYNYVQCPTKIYLNIHGDKEKRVPYSEFIQKKMEDGIIHEKEVIKGKKFEEIKIKDVNDAFKKTIELMESGVNLIYQGVLIEKDMLGRPDLLEKREGKSKFGDYHYVALDIKSGKRLKEEYKMQVMFYSLLLEKVQGRLPKNGYIININHEILDFNVKKALGKYNHNLNEIKKIIKGKKIAPTHLSKCAECVWREYCIPYMVKKQDISMIPRLGRTAKEKLNDAGIKTISDVAKCNKDRLNGVNMVKFQRQAEAISEDKVIVLKKPEFEDVETEIFFDIEGETELGIDYLYGLLVRQKGDEKFYGIWADKPEDEEKMWKEFLNFMDKIKDFKIYYYTSYEIRSMRKLKEKYGADRKLFDRIMNNMVDLHKVILRSAILPLYSYSIKPIAKYLGFKWRDSKAGGAQSMFWYSLWLKTKEKKWKKIILEYNEDDVIATRVLKDWLNNLI
ncbi:TM0106 family RecB-like putative nuclease [Candidatus Woesearchaeota archaeon]|nr:TM0106 family RecB-like putative nuclease [Candidatus Woesearchaeota archaeon]